MAETMGEPAVARGPTHRASSPVIAFEDFGPMYLRNGLPYNLGATSRRLYDAIASSLPYLLQFARAEPLREIDGLSLYIDIPSPTGDPDRPFVIWVDESITPSIGFGPSHYHEYDDDEGIAELIEWADAILNDEVVIIEYIGGSYPTFRSWIDLGDPEVLEEELTAPGAPDRVLIKCWSGNADREVSIESLEP